MYKTIGTVCVIISLFLDTASYWRQVAKILKTKKSSQVSSTSYIYKIAKVCFSMIGLSIYFNWVGFTMEVFMMLVYISSLVVIIKYKPKNWSLWK